MRLLTALLLIAFMALAQAAGTDPFGVGTALGLQAASMQEAGAGLAVEPQQVPQPQSAPAESRPAAPPFDYSVNLKSNVFGARLFTGSFARQGATQFNPDYAISEGDQIQVRFWGAFDFDAILTVDPKGNVFLPHVGPVQVQGVRNKDLQRVVDSAVAKVFRANVSSYASLAAAQPVRVFVSGFVHRPGLYDGTSMDSFLRYLDQAGGIDAERGSFLDIRVTRGKEVRARVNLYDFLLNGRLPMVQLADGDVIFVAPRQSVVEVSGLAENPNRFEFSGKTTMISRVIDIAKPLAQATHVRVVRNSGTIKNVEYFSLEEARGIRIDDGDEVQFTADKKPGTISVRVEGEHESAQEYVLPYGTRMGELLSRIVFSDRSDKSGLQLYRRSVQERQKAMLDASLKTLENVALTARSGTSDEARLRTDEANLLLKWVDRAKKVEPKGQVQIGTGKERDNLLLENGDVIRIPSKDGLVLINGEVLFPTAVAFEQGLGLSDYIGRAGGYTQRADEARLIVAHRDGSFSEMGSGDSDAEWSNSWFDDAATSASATKIRAGDQILVLPKVDMKSRQVTKDLTQILYQIAVSAKVVLGL